MSGDLGLYPALHGISPESDPETYQAVVQAYNARCLNFASRRDKQLVATYVRAKTLEQVTPKDRQFWDDVVLVMTDE